MHGNQSIKSIVDGEPVDVEAEATSLAFSELPSALRHEKAVEAYEEAGTKLTLGHDRKSVKEPKLLTPTAKHWLAPPPDNRHLDVPHMKTRRHPDPWEEKRGRMPKPPPPFEQISSMRIKRHAYDGIRTTIGKHAAESGGMLLSSTGDYTITDYVFDASAVTSGAAYNPNTDFLNRELDGREDHFIGIVHSHPPSFRRLSGQDQRAAWSNLTSPGNPHLHAYLMPLVMTIPDTGRFELIPFIVVCHQGGNGEVVVRPVDLKILD